MHDHGVDAHLTQEHHVFGEALLQVVVHHGIAAVLDHNGLAEELLQPWECLNEYLRFLIGPQIGMHIEMIPGSAQRACHESHSAFVIRVDMYIFVGKVVGPHASFALPGVQVDVYVDLAQRHVHLAPVPVRTAIGADSHAIDGD